MKTYFVYIMASQKNGTIYIGVTGNLIKRVYEHKNNVIEGFTSKYKIHKLVYYEQTNDIKSAIAREKKLKNWRRQWKTNLINEHNPSWKDLYDEFLKQIHSSWIQAYGF